MPQYLEIKTKHFEISKEIGSLINIEAITRNQYYFLTLIDIAAVLATHQLAFRDELTHLKTKATGKLILYFYSITSLKKTPVYVQSLIPAYFTKCNVHQPLCQKRTFCYYGLGSNEKSKNFNIRSTFDGTKDLHWNGKHLDCQPFLKGIFKVAESVLVLSSRNRCSLMQSHLMM